MIRRAKRLVCAAIATALLSAAAPAASLAGEMGYPVASFGVMECP